MYYKTFKKELNSKISRSVKKQQINQIYLTNFHFYSKLLKFSLLKYFFRNHLIYLNYKTLNKLLKEEITFLFILKN